MPSAVWSLVWAPGDEGGALGGLWLAQSNSALSLWRLSSNGSSITSQQQLAILPPGLIPGSTNTQDFGQVQGVLRGNNYITRVRKCSPDRSCPYSLALADLSDPPGSPFKLFPEPARPRFGSGTAFYALGLYSP